MAVELGWFRKRARERAFRGAVQYAPNPETFTSSHQARGCVSLANWMWQISDSRNLLVFE